MPSLARAALTGLAIATLPLAASVTVVPAAHAGDALAITRVTTANESGGLTPYIPLYTTVALTFTDDSPSDASDYRIDVTGEDYAEEHVATAWASEDPGTFEARLDAYALPLGKPLEITVTEVVDGVDTTTSPVAPFTFTFVDHPSRLSTSAKKVDGRWSYKAGSTARLSFTGEWEEGTKISTQVFVSKGKRFTGDDWSRNVYGSAALLKGKPRETPILSFKIPEGLKGKYVWISVLGWKPGEGGWVFNVKRAYVR